MLLGRVKKRYGLRKDWFILCSGSARLGQVKVIDVTVAFPDREAEGGLAA